MTCRKAHMTTIKVSVMPFCIIASRPCHRIGKGVLQTPVFEILSYGKTLRNATDRSPEMDKVSNIMSGRPYRWKEKFVPGRVLVILWFLLMVVPPLSWAWYRRANKAYFYGSRTPRFTNLIALFSATLISGLIVAVAGLSESMFQQHRRLIFLLLFYGALPVSMTVVGLALSHPRAIDKLIVGLIGLLLAVSCCLLVVMALPMS
jgi:hypothetical protein